MSNAPVVAEAHMVDRVAVPDSYHKNHPSKPHLSSLEMYEKMYNESIQDPDRFWRKMAKELLHWDRSFQTVRTGGFEHGNVAWFVEGQLNACYNCVDRHAFANPKKVGLRRATILTKIASNYL